MSVNLDNTTVKLLVSPNGDQDELVSAIFLNQQKKSLARLVKINKILLEQAPELSLSFREFYKIVLSSPKEVQLQVLSNPSSIYWINLTWELINRNWHINFPKMHIESHLSKFNRIAASIAILWRSNEKYDFRMQTNSHSTIPLPGLSKYLADPRKHKPYTEFNISIENGSLNFDTSNLSLIVNEPIDGFLQINDYDDLLELGGLTGFSFERLDNQTELSWREALKHSIQWIKTTNELLYNEIRKSVKVISPVISTSTSIHLSATFSEAPGLMALSWTPDISVLTEAIVHEYHHQKLNALLEIDPLITGPTTEPIYYSPWRQDPRPLLGLFHGAYVFQAILEFWVKFQSTNIDILDSERVKQRMFLIFTQTRIAIESLEKNAQLTSLGISLLHAMKENINKNKKLLPALSDNIISQIINNQKQHQINWENKHSNFSYVNNGISNKDELKSNIQINSLLGLEANFSVEKMLSVDYPNDILLKLLLEKSSSDQNWTKNLLETLNYVTDSLDAMLIYAHCSYLMKNFSDAIKWYSHCVAIKPKSAYLWECLAFAYRHQDNWDISKKILNNLSYFTNQKYTDPESMTKELMAY